MHIYGHAVSIRMQDSIRIQDSIRENAACSDANKTETAVRAVWSGGPVCNTTLSPTQRPMDENPVRNDSA